MGGAEILTDVAIVGCGPVGALLANLLGQAGLAVDIYDREREIHPLPRAVHFDGEVMRIFQRESYVSIDLHNRKLVSMSKGSGKSWFPGLPPIDREEHSFSEGDDLQAEIDSFLEACAGAHAPLVTGLDGRRALETAMRITASLRQSLAAAGLAS